MKNGASRLYLTALLLSVIFHTNNSIALTFSSQHKTVLRQLANALWSDTATKINQIKTNFTNRTEGTSLSFYAADPSTVCQVGPRSPTPVARIEYSFAESTTDLHVDLKYFGCNGRYLYHEILTVQGVGLVPLKRGAFLLGEREFALEDMQNLKDWQFIDGAGAVLFHIHSERRADNSEYSKIESLGQKILEIWADNKNLRHDMTDRIRMIFYGYNNSAYSSNGEHLENPYNFTTSTPIELEKQTDANDIPRTFFKSGDFAELPANQYDSFFSQIYLNTTKYGLGVLLAFNNQWFPTTQNSSGGDDSSKRFTEDLNLYVQKLRSGNPADIIFVQNQLLQLIKSVDKGEFIPNDHRP